MEGSFSNPGYLSFDLIEEGRRDIFKWSEKRRSRRSGLHGSLYKITKLFITRSLVRSFMHNLNVVVLFQMFLGAICTYSCVKLGLEMDVHMSLFVSPIVLPLAFSINANYQRRESVLEDLAMFKSSSSTLFFCHRDWIKAAELPVDLLKTLSNKLKFLVINIREYLLTEDSQKRRYILQVIYEDLSDIAQLNDKIRMSPLKSNSALVARIIHCHNLMCWSFERLRVIREYSSPRSLRAFTKVFIFLMPLLLSPYYVFSGRQTQSSWTPYFISIMVSFLFGSLQSVQDKLDDPFDGIGEDDVKLGQLDDWTTQSLLTNRTVTIGRFTVTTTTAQEERSPTPIPPLQQTSSDENSPMRTRHLSLGSRDVASRDVGSPKKVGRFSLNPERSPKRLRRILSRKGERSSEGRRSPVVELDETEFTDKLESRCHGIASKLEGLSGTSIILPGNRVPYIFNEYQGLKSPEAATIPIITKPSGNRLAVSENSKRRNVSGLRLDNRLTVVRESDEETSDSPSSPETLPARLQNMKSDAVVRPGESSIKRPTVLGLFASPEGNTHTQVSDDVFTPIEETYSSSTAHVSTSNRTEIASPKADEISSDNLPLLTLPALAVQEESGSDIDDRKTSCSTPEQQRRNEPTTGYSDITDEATGGSSELGRPPKLRFCLPSKRGARGDGVRLWGRRQKKKRPHLTEKCESDIELPGTTSMSPLLPQGVNQCSEKESDSGEPGLCVGGYSQDSGQIVVTESTNNGYANDVTTQLESTGDGRTKYGNVETGNADHGPTDGQSTDEIIDCTNSKPVESITEDYKPEIVVSPPVDEESSLWNFDVSSDKTNDSNIDGTCDAKEDNSNSIEHAQRKNNLNSISSIRGMPCSENVSPEPGGSRFSVSRNNENTGVSRNNEDTGVSRNNEDTGVSRNNEDTGVSKPRSSRFTVSPS